MANNSLTVLPISGVSRQNFRLDSLAPTLSAKVDAASVKPIRSMAIFLLEVFTRRFAYYICIMSADIQSANLSLFNLINISKLS